MPKPSSILIALLIAGVTAANVLVLVAQRSTPERVVTAPAKPVATTTINTPSVAAQVAQITAPTSPPPAPIFFPEKLSPAPAKSQSSSDAAMQIALLQEQVEYLQDQVQTLQKENSAMLDKLANMGAKDKPLAMGKGDGAPETIGFDYVSLGSELIAQRELQAAPIPAIPATVEDVEKLILASLRRRCGSDFGTREGAAFAALGVIPEAIDTLPLQAALLARQLGGWYDAEGETLLVIEPAPGSDPVLTHTDPVMALGYGALWQQFEKVLFPAKAQALSTDERLARLALIGGDAAQLRLHYQLKNPPSVKPRELPLDDPDHPMNQVPLPAYLRSLATFPLTAGMQFAQSLHSIGGYTQVTASYQRPPKNTAEVIDTERYFAEPAAPDFHITWPSTEVAKAKPLWDDSLGMAGISHLLRRYNADDAANAATHGWQTDRWLAFANAEKGHRGHVVWQSQWASAEDAARFYTALRECLAQQYRLSLEDKDGALVFKTTTRFVRLHRIALPQPSVLYIDAGDEAFAAALGEQFNPQPRPAKPAP